MEKGNKKNYHITLDNIIKHIKDQEKLRQEFVVAKEELKQIKKFIKKKFGLEIAAV